MSIEVTPMHVVSPSQMSSAVRALFTANMPGSLRCFAMLNGDTSGRVLTDDVERPTWAAVQELAYDRAIYFGGALSLPMVREVIEWVRRDGDVVMCIWRDDAQLAQWLPPPDYDGEAIDFTRRSGDLATLMRVPDGCNLRGIDADLLRRKGDYDAAIAAYGSESAALAKGLGYCLMRGDEILCEAFTGPPVDGVIELGVETREPYRRRGYAAVTCAHLIHTCEAMGLATFWNAAAQNAASIALARKLGYQREQPHRVLAWNKQKASQTR
jgi:RimJ/RimL family protein N-acetyltransferase